YDRDGNPLTDEEYDKYSVPGHRNKRVGRTDINSDVSVSTVWLGLNHGWVGAGPIIFETMVFGGDHDGWMQRYSSEEAAMRGHLQVVDALRSGTFFTEDD